MMVNINNFIDININKIKMVENISKKNFNLLIIVSILLFLLPICCNKQMNDFENKNPYYKYNRPDRRTDDPEQRTIEELKAEIELRQNEKNELEINCQKKKIYAIALGVLSGIFLILIIIFAIFKCYLFCDTKKESKTPYRRIRISRLGQVFLEESLAQEKSEIKDNSFVNNENININNSVAPTCFSVSQKTSTFDPNNFEENNNYFKPVNNENN